MWICCATSQPTVSRVSYFASSAKQYYNVQGARRLYRSGLTPVTESTFCSIYYNIHCTIIPLYTISFIHACVYYNSANNVYRIIVRFYMFIRRYFTQFCFYLSQNLPIPTIISPTINVKITIQRIQDTCIARLLFKNCQYI
jgi:hypothetical protein